jgi:hypothetical protein
MRDVSVTHFYRHRGAAEVPADPFVFRWSVSEAGYEWAVGKDGKVRLFTRDTPGLGIRYYVPEPGLFREFVALASTREAIQAFAGQYGDLFDRWDITNTPVRGGRLAGGTALERWKIKIGDMRDLVTLWDQIQEKRLSELRKIIVRSNGEVCYVRGVTNITLAREPGRFRPTDVLLPARCALQLEINKRLADVETPTLTVPGLSLTPDGHQRIVFRPCNLLAAMWMQFAQATTGADRLRQCVGCGMYFPVGPGAKRGHSITCSSKCRQRKSRMYALPTTERGRRARNSS